MQPTFRSADYFKITVFGFALTALWSSLHSIILPLRLLDLVDEAHKNTYLGLLTFSGLVLAMLVQPVAGALSDRSTSRWGRRRPFVLLGSLIALLFLPGIALFQTYAAVFICYCLMQVATNTAQGPYQAFIPDLVPPPRRGVASGVKTLMEIAGGFAFARLVGYFMGNYTTSFDISWLWLSLLLIGAILLTATLVTITLVRDCTPGTGTRFSWSKLLSVFTIDVHVGRSFIWFLVSRLFVFMAFATLQTFALYFIRDVVGIANPAAATADLLIAIGAGMLLSVYPAGRLSDRFGRKPVAVSSGFLGAIAVGIIFLVGDYSYLLVVGALLGVSIGGFMTSNWALAIDIVPPGEEARYLGLANIATAGGAAAARLIGPAIDALNAVVPGQGYSLMMAGCLVYFIIGSLLMLRIKTVRS